MKNKHIKEAIGHVFGQTEPIGHRFIKMVSYCKGVDGPKDYGNMFCGLCDDTECHNCRNFENMFKEEVERQINEIDQKNS